MRTRAEGSIIDGEEQIRSSIIFAIVSLGSSSVVREVCEFVDDVLFEVARHFLRKANTLCRRFDVSKRVVVLS